MKKCIGLLLLFLPIIFSVNAQILDPARWEYSIAPKDLSVGETAELKFEVKIDQGWYVYSSDFSKDLGPKVTELVFDMKEGYELVGGLESPDAKHKYDDIWGGEIGYFKNSGTFIQKIKILKDNPKISGIIDYQVCSDESGQCITKEEEFSFFETVNQKSADKETALEELSNDEAKAMKSREKKDDSLFGFMILAFLSGLVALLTPCVFPMIPMTVSFFTGSGDNKKEGLTKALVYGFSIIGIYTIIGTFVAAVFGADFANWLSTHWVPNLAFFIIFMIFAASFLGMFEITLPSSVVNKVDKQADKGGYYGIFFMAFTLVLVSFSCTGPIVGTILVKSAGGEFLKPVLGMFSFALAFAIPFTLFAIFPNWLKNLPRSGGWLNTVKVTLGFVEIALGLKFLSVADQVYHWGILDREVYLSIWIAVFTLLGLYFLGKISLPHDSKLEKISVPRLLIAIVTFSFVVYLIPGLWGAPLKSLSGYLPPMTTQDFNLNRINQGYVGQAEELCDTPKYNEFLHLPHGIQGYFDYNQALACAKKQDKPIFVDFTGHGCVNCREMEARVWSDPKVLKILQQDYIVVALYIDDKTELSKADWYTSTYDGKVKKTIGKQNADFQISKYNNNAQPFYLLLDTNGELLEEPRSYDLDVNSFVTFLKDGLKKFNK